MWSNNSTTFGLCYNTQYCMCHTAIGTSPMTQYLYNNVQLSSTTFPSYQSIPDNTIFGFSHASNLVNPLFHVGTDQAAGEQMTTSENYSWLLPNLYNNQIDGSMNLTSYCSLTGNQDDGQFDQMLLNYNERYGQSSKEGLVKQQGQALNFSQNDYSTSPSIFYPGASLHSTGAGIIPEATIGTMSLQREWALGVHPGILVQETVGSHSSSTSSLETQQLASRDDFKPASSRQERILRYFEKKNSRKYEKKIIYSSRKTYARTRPRVRGRFARSSQN